MEISAGRGEFKSLKSEAARLEEENERLEKRNKQLEKEIEQLKINQRIADAEKYYELLREEIAEIGIVNFFGVQWPEPMQHDFLRALTDSIQKKEKKTVTFLMDQHGYCVATSSEVAQEKGIAANELLKIAADIAGGSGGGRANMAQGRVKDPSRFLEIRKKLVNYIEERVKL